MIIISQMQLYPHSVCIAGRAINPSDCVDMECDGLKKALIVDRDGTLLGGTGGSVIPQVIRGMKTFQL